MAELTAQERKAKIEAWMQKKASAVDMGAATPSGQSTVTQAMESKTMPEVTVNPESTVNPSESTLASESTDASKSKAKKAKPEPVAKAVPVNPITLPAIHGQMAEISYLQSNMTMQDVGDRLHYAEDDYDEDTTAEDKYQRKLNKSRVKSQILPYLTADAHFFAPLVVALREGDYEFTQGEMGVGMLTIHPDAKCPLLDGQHRKYGIDLRLEDCDENDTFPIETIGVIFVVDLSTDQRQQLFSDLNRNAKLPPKAIGILYDHRDNASVITRMVADSPLFKGKVSMESNVLSKKVGDSGKYQIITLGVLYEMVKSLIFSNPDAKGEKLVKEDLQKLDPSEVAAYCSGIIGDVILRNLPMSDTIIKDVKEAPDLARKAYICYASVGWQSIARAVSEALDFKVSTDVIGKGIKSIDWTIDHPNWKASVLNGKPQVKKENIKSTTGVVRAALIAKAE